MPVKRGGGIKDLIITLLIGAVFAGIAIMFLGHLNGGSSSIGQAIEDYGNSSSGN